MQYVESIHVLINTTIKITKWYKKITINRLTKYLLDNNNPITLILFKHIWWQDYNF